jgi:DNA polymerase-1
MQFSRVYLTSIRSIFVSADYSQIEMRLLAHLSGDANLCDLFHQSGDIYYLLAGKLFSKPISDITDDERHQAKIICLGTGLISKLLTLLIG